MKEETRQRLSELILEELAEKIRGNESLKRRLEVFTDLPVEKVADAIIKQFDYLLSSDLRELILHMIEQEVAQEKMNHSATAEPLPEVPETLSTELPPAEEPEPVEEEAPVEETAAPVEEIPQRETPSPPVHADTFSSIMEHFGPKEPFHTEPMDITLLSSDWLYLHGFSYAPESSGKGTPIRRLSVGGIDQSSYIFLMDYGDVRLFVSKLKSTDYPNDKGGKPTLSSQKASEVRLAHERIVNTLRSEEVVVPFPSWSIVKGVDSLIKAIERNYVDALRALIDMHDATDWNVDVMVLDDHLMQLPSIAEAPKERAASRSSRHTVGKGVDVRKMERVIFKEKTLAQEIHNELLIHAAKNRVDYMVRLDSAMMGDWKSILSARYTVGKDKRKVFCHDIADLQRKYEEFQLLFTVSTPSKKFTFAH